MIVFLTACVLLESANGGGEMANDSRVNRTSPGYDHYIGAQYAVLECARNVTRHIIGGGNGTDSSCKTTEDVIPKIAIFINASVACGALDDDGAATLSRLATYLTPFAFTRMKSQYLKAIHSRREEIDACKNETHIDTTGLEGDILQHSLIFNEVGCLQSRALETCVTEALDDLRVEGLVRYVADLFRGVRELGRCACETQQIISSDGGSVATAAILSSVTLVAVLVAAVAVGCSCQQRRRRCRRQDVDGYPLSNIDTKNTTH